VKAINQEINPKGVKKLPIKKYISSGNPSFVKPYNIIEIALGHHGELKMRIVNPTNKYSVFLDSL
jgi:hypothetical protein